MINAGNMVTGLGGTKAVSLPMFTAFRRFSILITMILEFKILGVKPSLAVQMSVWCMLGGSMLAAVDDLSFTIEGYSYIMLANFMTAAYGVYVKEKLDTVDIGKYGIMFYNSAIMILPAILLAWFTGDLHIAYNYKHWAQPMFFIQFFSTCFMGFVLTYSTFLCTQYNSALTTAMVGNDLLLVFWKQWKLRLPENLQKYSQCQRYIITYEFRTYSIWMVFCMDFDLWHFC